ncbi:two-component system response regulator [Ciceribacter sp. RN22]|uniref:response regulator n=1 Tax=Ciceribacter sp. RN22 TaxID=2954932 RepID=UPI00209302CF|nr:response regulator [Ciceribacter sp. RN22]MCO6176596.1 response regulator [Ciceribacter sp. RN22]
MKGTQNYRRKMLIIEDHVRNREYYVDAIMALFQDVVDISQTAYADRAVSMIDKSFFLVMSDINVLGGTGISFVRELRSHPDLAHIPVVAVTAHDLLQPEFAASRVLFNGVLLKPVSIDALRDTVSFFLGRNDG